MQVELPGIHTHVLPAFVEKHALQKDPDFARLEIGYKDLGARKGRVRGPLGRLREGE